MTTMPVGPPPSQEGARVAAYLHHAGFSSANLVTAVAIAKAESGWVYDKRGGPNKDGSYDFGLMQINSSHNPSDAVKTQAIPNAQVAFKLYKAAGNKFTDWASYNSGAYKQYLPDARAAVKQLQDLGPSWERETIRLAPTYDSPISANPSDLASKAQDALSGPFAALGSQLAKLGGNAAAITVAVVLVVLGVMLIRGKTIVQAAGVLNPVVGAVGNAVTGIPRSAPVQRQLRVAATGKRGG